MATREVTSGELDTIFDAVWRAYRTYDTYHGRHVLDVEDYWDEDGHTVEITYGDEDGRRTGEWDRFYAKRS